MKLLLKDAMNLVSERGSYLKKDPETGQDLQIKTEIVAKTEIAKTSVPNTKFIIKCLELRTERTWSGSKQLPCNESTCEDFPYCKKLKRALVVKK